MGQFWSAMVRTEGFVPNVGLAGINLLTVIITHYRIHYVGSLILTITRFQYELHNSHPTKFEISLHLKVLHCCALYSVGIGDRFICI